MSPRTRRLMTAVLVIGTLATFSVRTLAAGGLVPNTMRDPVQLTATQVDSLGQSTLADVYGGLRIDNKAGVVDVLLTRLSGPAEAALAGGVAHPEMLRFSLGRHTLQELFAIQKRIEADYSALASQGIHLSGVGIGFGVVGVSVEESNAEIPATLHERYGQDAITVTLGTVIRNTATQTREGPPPYMGGMEVDNIGNASSASGFYADCTSGFIAQNVINSVPFFYIITAGHCFGPDQLVYHWYSASNTPLPVGYVNYYNYYNGTTADAEAISIQGGVRQATNQVITAEPDVHTVDYVAAAQLNGLAICHSGLATDQSCNFSVNYTHYTIYVRIGGPNGYTVQQNDQVGACCDNVNYGDSGGPVYHYYQPQAIDAEGIQSAATFYSNGNPTGQIWYSFIQNVRSALGMNICLSTPNPTTGC